MTTSPPKAWLVFGEALVDKFPDAIVTGGAPFNVARHLAGLAQDVRFITRLGADAYGHTIRDEMQRMRMPLGFVQEDREHATGTVSVTQAANGSHEFHILANQAYDHVDSEELMHKLDELERPKVDTQLYHGTLCLRSTASRRAWKALCTRGASPRFVDMNWRDGHLTPEAAWAAMQGADLLKLSNEELALVLGWQGKASAASQAPARPGVACAQLGELSSALQLGTLIVTYGALGSAVYERGVCTACAQSTPLAQLVDTVGAGDAFSAVCMASTGKPWGWQLTLERAGDFAAAICGLRGAVPAEADSAAFYAHWQRQWQL
jgi:fructokinase